MRGSLPTLVTVLIPRFQDSSQVDPDERRNEVQLTGAEAMTAGKPKRFEPKLAGLVLPFHMNVRWLAAVEAREEDSIRPTNTADSRHSKSLLLTRVQRAR